MPRQKHVALEEREMAAIGKMAVVAIMAALLLMTAVESASAIGIDGGFLSSNPLGAPRKLLPPCISSGSPCSILRECCNSGFCQVGVDNLVAVCP